MNIYEQKTEALNYTQNVNMERPVCKCMVRAYALSRHQQSIRHQHKLTRGYSISKDIKKPCNQHWWKRERRWWRWLWPTKNIWWEPWTNKPQKPYSTIFSRSGPEEWLLLISAYWQVLVDVDSWRGHDDPVESFSLRLKPNMSRSGSQRKKSLSEASLKSW